MAYPTKANWKRMLAICRSLKNGATYQAAFKAADVTSETVWRWRRKWPRFGDIIQNLWDQSVVRVVEDAHYSAAVRGNVIAQMHILHNRKRDKWQRMPDTIVQQTTQVSVATKIEYKEAPVIIFTEANDALTAQIQTNRLESPVGESAPA